MTMLNYMPLIAATEIMVLVVPRLVFAIAATPLRRKR
jgi:hypothetical protein